MVEVLPGDASTTLNLIRDLHWIDFKTRVVTVEYMYYNGDLDLFGETRITIEFLPSGAIETTLHTGVISTNR